MLANINHSLENTEKVFGSRDKEHYKKLKSEGKFH